MELVIEMTSVMFIAGDPSGDIHAAPVIRELRHRLSTVEVWGIGGPNMGAEGFSSLMPFEPFNRMGFVEVVRHLDFFLKAKKYLIQEMYLRKPDCLVCVDYPGFNMPLMKAANKLGIPVVWYIAPMVWAWKRKRAEVLGKCASHIACIFPFEVEYFSPYTEKVSFVGNPTVEMMKTADLRSGEEDKKVSSILLVPGSRKQEIDRMLRPMLDAFRILKKEYPYLSATVSAFHTLDKSIFDMVKEYESVSVSSEPLSVLLKSARCAIVKSGTSTLETALSTVPMVIAYKTSRVTYEIAKRLVNVKYIGLPNIIAKEEIVPECIQDEMTPSALSQRVRRFITDREYYNSTIVKLSALRAMLGAKKPSAEVAEIICSVKSR